MLIKELCLFLLGFLGRLLGNEVSNKEKFMDNCLIGSYEYGKYNESNYANCLKVSGGDQEFIFGCIISDVMRKK